MTSADIFHYVSAVLATIAAAMLIWHMNRRWPEIRTLAQRMRYITLLWFVMSVAYAAAYDIQIGRLIELSNVFFSIGCLLVIATMVVSNKEPKLSG
jgi:uncharacterized membrane protein